MKSGFVNIYFFLLLILTLSSCGSSRRTSTEKMSTHALSKKLSMPITSKDNIRLYTEAANWIGTPYKYGGTTKKGVDCSGLTGNIYKEVYRKHLSRSTADILKKDCKKISKGSLKEGDLVFFNTNGKKKTASHVGIYLKDGKFIHSSTSRGVIINNLSEPYYARNWLAGGRVK